MRGVFGIFAARVQISLLNLLGVENPRLYGVPPLSIGRKID